MWPILLLWAKRVSVSNRIKFYKITLNCPSKNFKLFTRMTTQRRPQGNFKKYFDSHNIHFKQSKYWCKCNNNHTLFPDYKRSSHPIKASPDVSIITQQKIDHLCSGSRSAVPTLLKIDSSKKKQEWKDKAKYKSLNPQVLHKQVRISSKTQLVVHKGTRADTKILGVDDFEKFENPLLYCAITLPHSK